MTALKVHFKQLYTLVAPAIKILNNFGDTGSLALRFYWQRVGLSSLYMQTTMSNNSDNIENTVAVPAAAPVTAEASIPLSIEPCTLSKMEEHITQLETQLHQLQQSIQSKTAEINHAKRRINYIRKSQIKNATIAKNKDGTTKRKRFRKVCTTGKSALVFFYLMNSCVQ